MRMLKTSFILAACIAGIIAGLFFFSGGAHMTVIFKNESDQVISNLRINRVKGGFNETVFNVQPGASVTLKGSANDESAESDLLVKFNGVSHLLTEREILLRGTPMTVYITIYYTKRGKLIANRTWKNMQTIPNNEK